MNDVINLDALVVSFQQGRPSEEGGQAIWNDRYIAALESIGPALIEYTLLIKAPLSRKRLNELLEFDSLVFLSTNSLLSDASRAKLCQYLHMLPEPYLHGYIQMAISSQIPSVDTDVS